MVIETKTDLQTAILENLKTGKENALTGKVIADRLGERDTRKIRLAIQDLIEQGYPIIGMASDGYYIAGNANECKENLDYLMNYLKMIAQHHKNLLKASRNILDPYQLEMKL